jgi:release factor glutamine methyltransferase
MPVDHSLRSLLSHSPLPANESRILLAHILEQHYQLPRSAVIARDHLVLCPTAFAEWHALETRRMAGEPIAYLIGKKGFHGIELYVAPGVLIPRPETELLVDIALAEIQMIPGSASVLDLGTGSGAIALAIAHAASQALVVATDQSTQALAIANKNRDLLNLAKQVAFAEGSWYEALKSVITFDVIVSNPPYIPAHDPHLSQGDLRFEPGLALTDLGDGLSCLEIIISQAGNYLKSGGLLAVEHGFDQSEAVVRLMITAGLREIQTYTDLAGHQRVVSGRK